QRHRRQGGRGRPGALRDGPAASGERVPVQAVDSTATEDRGPKTEDCGTVGAVTGMQPAYDIEAWRAQIPLLRSCIPMNNCSQAPQTDTTRAAAERYLESWNASGMDWDAWMAEVALAKAAFAKLVGAAPEDIAVFSSVSEATSAV